jgi:hypothetical protein
MARRRTTKKTTRTRKKQGVSILGMAETYALLNVASQTAFNTNVVQFLTSRHISGSSSITLNELMKGGQYFYDRPDVAGVQGSGYYIMQNLRNNWVKGATQMVIIPMAFRFGKKLGRPAITRTNRLLNQAGIGSTVKL